MSHRILSRTIRRDLATAIGMNVLMYYKHQSQVRPPETIAGLQLGVCHSRDLDRFASRGHRIFLLQSCDRYRALRNAHYLADSGSYVSSLSVSSDREGLARNAQPGLHYKQPSYYYNSMYLP